MAADPAKLPIDNLKFGRIRHDRIVNPTCPSCHVKTSESIRSFISADGNHRDTEARIAEHCDQFRSTVIFFSAQLEESPAQIPCHCDYYPPNRPLHRGLEGYRVLQKVPCRFRQLVAGRFVRDKICRKCVTVPTPTMARPR